MKPSRITKSVSKFSTNWCENFPVFQATMRISAERIWSRAESAAKEALWPNRSVLSARPANTLARAAELPPDNADVSRFLKEARTELARRSLTMK